MPILEPGDRTGVEYRAADGIAVIDTATLRPRATLRGVSDPERVDVSQDGRTLFVTEEDAARLAVIDAAHASVTTRIPVGREPEGVRVSPNGNWVLVTSEEENALAIIDARKQTASHGTPPDLLRCELGAVGYRQTAFYDLQEGTYLAVFASPAAGSGPVSPADIRPCTPGRG